MVASRGLGLAREHNVNIINKSAAPGEAGAAFQAQCDND